MKKKILIIDDEPNIVKLLSLRLRAKSYEVFVAYDGLEGVKIAEKEIPDLIIMDVKMPHGGGIGAFEKLIQLDLSSRIPVIFMTASYPKLTIEDQVLKMGAKACIAKPYVGKDFEQTIAMALG